MVVRGVVVVVRLLLLSSTKSRTERGKAGNDSAKKKKGQKQSKGWGKRTARNQDRADRDSTGRFDGCRVYRFNVRSCSVADYRLTVTDCNKRGYRLTVIDCNQPISDVRLTVTSGRIGIIGRVGWSSTVGWCV